VSAATASNGATEAPKSGRVPEVFGVPLTLLLAIVVVAFAGALLTRRLVR
jgi:ribose/xylose/arabinose/galactoside ABC-type transport system permease subunit